MTAATEDSGESSKKRTERYAYKRTQKIKNSQKEEARAEKTRGHFYNVPFDEDGNSTIVGVTEEGKKLHAKKYPRGYFYVVFYPGGVLPKRFKSLFTSYEELQENVKEYLSGG